MRRVRRRAPRAVVRCMLILGRVRRVSPTSGSRSKGLTLPDPLVVDPIGDPPTVRSSARKAHKLGSCREDRRVREAGARRDLREASRRGHEPARPVGRGRAERHRRERGRGGAPDQGGPRRRGRRRLARACEGGRLAAQGPRDGRRPRAARLRRRCRRIRPRRDELRARACARARGGRPRPLRPAVVGLRRRRPLGRRRRPAAPPADLPGRRPHGRRTPP